MKKFTELLFRFPVKVYDSAQLRRSEHKEDIMLSQEEDNVDWAVAWIKIPLSEITDGGGYMESSGRERNIASVIEEGFDNVHVMTKTLGDYLCAWNMEKFEKKLNEHIEMIEKEREAFHVVPPPQKKMSKLKQIWHNIALNRK